MAVLSAADVPRLDPYAFLAVLGKRVRCVLVVLRRLQQGLGWDTANVGAGAARRRLAVCRLPVVDARGFHAELRRAYCRDVSAGAGAYHNDIKIFRHLVDCA